MHLQKNMFTENRIQKENEFQLMSINLNRWLRMSHNYMSISKNKSVTVDDESRAITHCGWWNPREEI